MNKLPEKLSFKDCWKWLDSLDWNRDDYMGKITSEEWRLYTENKINELIDYLAEKEKDKQIITGKVEVKPIL